MGFESFYNDNKNLIYYVLHKKFPTLKDSFEMEDLVQIGNIALWKTFVNVDENKGNVSTLFTHIYSNELKQIIRKKNTLKRQCVKVSFNDDINESDCPCHVSDIIKTNDETSMVDLLDIIDNVLKSFKSNHQEIIYLWLEGYTQIEISRKVGHAQKTIGAVVKNFKKEVMKKWEE